MGTATSTTPVIAAERLQSVRELVAKRAHSLNEVIEDSIAVLLEEEAKGDRTNLTANLAVITFRREAAARLLEIQRILSESDDLGYLVLNIMGSKGDGAVDELATELIGELLR